MHKLQSIMTAVLVTAVSPFCFSQAVIVDSKPMGAVSTQTTSTVQSSSPSAASQSEFYYQLQMLQEEVQQLRGIVEEQAHEIRRLKQQQLDDYVDLDRRISQLSKAGVSASPSTSLNTGAVAAVPTPSTKPAVAGKSASPEAELASYDKAVRLIIKDKQLDAGAEAMQAYLNEYPNGVYISNAQYWLGQVAFIQGDMEAAKKWFTQLLETNPNSQKAPEAKYKLGTVLHKLGNDSEAKTLLTEVASTNSSAARLAQEYLKTNF